MRWSISWAFIIAVSAISNTEAAPSTSVKWLMNEPASLFDIGMVRMRIDNRERWTPELMKELNGKNLKLDNFGVGSVVYNWDENIITIGVGLIGNPTEDLCKDALGKYKKVISPVSKDSNLRYVFMSNDFEHINYTSKSRPKNMDENISKLFVFTVGISDKPGFEGRTISCSSRFDSDTPTVKKFGF